MTSNLLRWIAPLAISACFVASQSPLSAQPIIPASDGTNTQVNPMGNTFTIQGGSLSGDGANLFHSFQRFGLSADQVANFLSNPQTRNIFSRIVGGDPSVIDGLLRVTGSNANLFLINPAGVIFGPNSRLDVPGDFMATTATRVGFGGDRWFNAFGQNDYASLVGTPSFFMFDAAQSGSIINAGNLSVQEGKNLVLLGGNIINTGQLNAPNGSVNVATVPGTGRVRISRPGGLLSLEVEATNSSGQAIPITPLDLPKLLTVGAAGLETGVTATSENTVQLANSAVQIPTAPGTTVISGQVSVAGRSLPILTAPELPQINVLGDRVALLNANLDASGLNGGGTIRVGGDYQGKGTVPNAKRTFVSADSFIRADAINTGDGGRILVWADERTSFLGQGSVKGGANSGNGGFAEVSGKDHLGFNGFVDVGATNGYVGTLFLDPQNITITNTPGAQLVNMALLATLGDTNNTQDFTINANSLQAQLGNISLQATNSITLEVSLDFVPGNGSITFNAGEFNGGIQNNITAPGRDLTITAGSITAGKITTNTDTPGANGGNITLTATSGGIQTGLLRSSSDFLNTINPIDGRKGGDITLNATGDIVVTGDRFSGSIKTGEYAPSGSMTLKSGGNITLTGFASASNFLQPGNIRIEVAGKLTLTEGSLSIENRLNNPDANPTTMVVKARELDLEELKGNQSNRQGLPASTGLISLQIDENIRIGTLRNEGYPVQITSANGRVDLGNVNMAGANGGELSISAPGGIKTGLINTSGNPGNGGNVTLTTFSDIEVNAINAQGGTGGIGGTVSTTSQFFRATGTIAGTTTSIATTGGQGSGSQTIRHDGGKEQVPFTVGQANPKNGTIGALVSSATDNIDQGTFPGSYTTPGSNIRLITQDPQRSTPPPDPTPTLSPPPEQSPIPPNLGNPKAPKDSFPEDVYDEIEKKLTREYESALGLDAVRIKSLKETQRELKEMGDISGLRVALVYAFFSHKGLTERFPDGKVDPKYGIGDIMSSMKVEPKLRDKYKLYVLLITSDQAFVIPGGKSKESNNTASFKEVAESVKGLLDNIHLPPDYKSYLEDSKKLYAWLIQPVDEVLEKIAKNNEKKRIHHLSFLMDRGLRALPVAALASGENSDGKPNFLVEKYSVGLMPSYSLVKVGYQNISSEKLWALGTIDGFSDGTAQPKHDPIKEAPFEMSTLIGKCENELAKPVWQGDLKSSTCFLNEKFTTARLSPCKKGENSKDNECREDVKLVHLITHAHFSKYPQDSYVFFHNRKMTIEEVDKLKLDSPPPPPIELLSFSACSTGVGNEDVELGFAGAAVKTRVKTVLATLWDIENREAFVLASEFYRQLSTQKTESEIRDGKTQTKAYALQEAQKAMISKKTYINREEETMILSDETSYSLKSPFPVNGKYDKNLSVQPLSAFEHPRNWAGMALIGAPW
jgi:filamentous hemagglutinin family protein